ncbi:MAG: VOC family protein [Spirochaetales bacterium]|nr:VOC family protein [Spirochaetales bacterium]
MKCSEPLCVKINAEEETLYSAQTAGQDSGFGAVHHVAVKVSDIHSTLESLAALGFTVEEPKLFEEVGMHIAFAGEESSRIEFFETLGTKGPGGEAPLGLHHVGVTVQNIDATYNAMKANPLFQVEGPIRQGAHARIFFFRLKAEAHSLFECVENKKA